MEYLKKILTKPKNFIFPNKKEFIEKKSFEEFDAEIYIQNNGAYPNGEITQQRVVMAFPKHLKEKNPAVVVPFYYPDAALAVDLKTGEVLPKYAENPTMLDIVRHGYIAISAEAYHLNYIWAEYNINDFAWWANSSAKLNADYPDWCGVGKLVSDTKLLIDMLEEDNRVDRERIGIAGHSLGGKMAFYTGCLDQRIKAILASDFGMAWDSTNWQDSWYFGKKLEKVKASGVTNADLLAMVAPKPFCLLAGESDNYISRQMMDNIKGYEENPNQILIIDHKAGHRPPKYAAEAGYLFLDHFLKP